MEKEMLNKFLQWHKRQYSHRQRTAFMIVQGIFFLILLPLIFFLTSRRLDVNFGFPEILASPFNLYLGLLLFAAGLFFAFWSVRVQFKIGQGTPVPMMPTKKLVETAPYTYCRNPMGLGTVILFIGLGIVLNSLSFVVISILLFVLLFLYYKFIEEKELVARYGEEYLAYRKRTPFLIPTFRRKK